MNRNVEKGWQTQIRPNERQSIALQIAQTLRIISPSISEVQLMNMALSFERQAFDGANSKHEYLTTCSKKTAQLRDQIREHLQAAQMKQAQNFRNNGNINTVPQVPPATAGRMATNSRVLPRMQNQTMPMQPGGVQQQFAGNVKLTPQQRQLLYQQSQLQQQQQQQQPPPPQPVSDTTQGRTAQPRVPPAFSQQQLNNLCAQISTLLARTGTPPIPLQKLQSMPPARLISLYQNQVQKFRSLQQLQQQQKQDQQQTKQSGNAPFNAVNSAGQPYSNMANQQQTQPHVSQQPRPANVPSNASVRQNLEMLNIPVPKQLFAQIPGLPSNIKLWRDVIELGKNQRLTPEQAKAIGILYQKHMQVLLQHRQLKMQSARVNQASQTPQAPEKFGNVPVDPGVPATSQQAYAQQMRNANVTNQAVNPQGGNIPLNIDTVPNSAKPNYQNYAPSTARATSQSLKSNVSPTDVPNIAPSNVELNPTFNASVSPPSYPLKSSDVPSGPPVANQPAEKPFANPNTSGNVSAYIVQQLLESGGTMGQQKMTVRIRELTERVMHSMIRPIPLELPHDQKVIIAELVKSAYPMFSRTNQLIYLFYCLTANEEATVQLIQMRHIFKLQLEGLQQGVFTSTPQMMAKIKEKTSRYFAYVRTQLIRLHHEVKVNGQSLTAALAQISTSMRGSSAQQQHQQQQQQQRNQKQPQAQHIPPQYQRNAGMQPQNEFINKAQTASLPSQVRNVPKPPNESNLDEHQLNLNVLTKAQQEAQLKEKAISEVMKHSLRPEDLKLPIGKRKKLEHASPPANIPTTQKPSLRTPEGSTMVVDETPVSSSMVNDGFNDTLAKGSDSYKAREEATANPLKYAIDAFVTLDHEDEISAVKSGLTPNSAIKTPQSFFIPSSTPDLNAGKNSLSPANILTLEGKFTYDDDAELWADGIQDSSAGNEVTKAADGGMEMDVKDVSMDADSAYKIPEEESFVKLTDNENDPWNDFIREKQLTTKRKERGEDINEFTSMNPSNIWQVVI
ncbi:mediator complex subunit Med15 [Schizosaccharomyces octosporus yFS286]|uniref:Mediator of RNA polymerase II transcription subunit 15 n=1 Tax=Schizosaccharomyces octosporus (strain yFS286) TaxID=483514 RepID=S9PYZ9_SCHOY|nr:mediator complex subunit Med15 [Schizosaccharomyces octosporus yFS286]EPX74316.1 mediator complex subunit Med15 [Schizosaccharomyces octosporus yFS286]